jgi:hypothetical protein
MILEAHGFCGEVSYYCRLIKRPFVFEAFRLRQSRRDRCIDRMALLFARTAGQPLQWDWWPSRPQSER